MDPIEEGWSMALMEFPVVLQMPSSEVSLTDSFQTVVDRAEGNQCDLALSTVLSNVRKELDRIWDETLAEGRQDASAGEEVAAKVTACLNSMRDPSGFDADGVFDIMNGE